MHKVCGVPCQLLFPRVRGHVLNSVNVLLSMIERLVSRVKAFLP
jgi:hypothetical protein